MEMRLEGKELWRLSVPISHSNGSWPLLDQIRSALALSGQLWAFPDVMYLLGNKSFSTSNWFIYTALPVASQLQVKHNASQEDDPASSTFFWVHCYPVLTWYNTGFQSLESVARGLCTAWQRKKQELYLVLLS